MTLTEMEVYADLCEIENRPFDLLPDHHASPLLIFKGTEGVGEGHGYANRGGMSDSISGLEVSVWRLFHGRGDGWTVS